MEDRERLHIHKLRQKTYRPGRRDPKTEKFYHIYTYRSNNVRCKTGSCIFFIDCSFKVRISINMHGACPIYCFSCLSTVIAVNTLNERFKVIHISMVVICYQSLIFDISRLMNKIIIQAFMLESSLENFDNFPRSIES